MPSLEELLSQMYTQTAPLRTATVGNLQSILSGAPASSLPAYAPNRAAIEGQYSIAENQLRSSLPRGGLLQSSLADLIGKRAGAVSDLESAVRGGALNQAATLGVGAVPGLISGTGTAQDLALRRKIAEQQRLNDLLRNIGSGVDLFTSILGLF